MSAASWRSEGIVTGRARSHSTQRLYAVTILRGEELVECPLTVTRTREEINSMLARGYTLRCFLVEVV